MHSFTPRTCLWPLTGALILTFGLSIGLTFRSNHACYAGVCGEWLFPLQARLHVVVWYCWLAVSVTILGLRAFHHNISKVLRMPLFRTKVPLLRKELHLSGLLTVSWIVILYGIVTGIWWQRLEAYFDERGQRQGSTQGNRLLAAIALTGHYGDITMGMALLPVSRHSALASFFKLSISTTLTFHMLTAYTLFGLVLIHGFLYIAWLATRSTISLDILQSYPILEPTYEAHEVYPGNTSSLGIWRASLPFTGTAAALIMLIILVTAMPKIRTLHFNLFYFTHLTSILAVIVVCLHASTMFYCTAPGLAMIVLDWGMRMYELRQSLEARVAHLGRGWYLLSVGLPRQRLRGCSCKSPLAHFYIRHGDSSIRELHPFTTITHLATQNNVADSQETLLPIQFLFRKSRSAKVVQTSDTITTLESTKQIHPLRRLVLLLTCNYSRGSKDRQLQWTEKLAGLADSDEKISVRRKNDDENARSHNLTGHVTRIRFEGPYFTPAVPDQYDTVVCIVAGTGVSGALAIAAAFAARWDGTADKDDDTAVASTPVSFKDRVASIGSVHSSQTIFAPASTWSRLSIWWSVRADDHIDLPFESLRSRPGLEVLPFLTGPGRPRMDIPNLLSGLNKPPSGSQGIEPFKSQPKKIWAYISGPNGFISAAEAACKQAGVDYYGARWDV